MTTSQTGEPASFTAFAGHRLIGEGDIATIALAIHTYGPHDRPLMIFDDQTGGPVELDMRHGPDEAVREYLARTTPAAARPGRGRPRLGVVAREVTLLPRHWDWLAAQPGGASAALRRLVEDARRTTTTAQSGRARDAAYKVMSALAGDLPGFEESSRALFAGDLETLSALTSGWPQPVRDYVLRMAAEA